MKRLLGFALATLLIAAAAGMLVLHLVIPMRPVIRLDSPRIMSRRPVRAQITEGTVDVNHADVEALQELNGVGPALAERIVEERTQNGLFSYPEDLIAVKGIGEKTLEKMRDQIQINK